MSHTPLTRIIREEFLRAIVFAICFIMIISATSVTVAYAATSGGKFGEILNKILVKTWDDPTNDGTVKNAEKLGGQPASAYTRSTGGFTCASATQCIYGIQANGTPMCR